jgi:hypothetical protein
MNDIGGWLWNVTERDRKSAEEMQKPCQKKSLL